MLARCAKKVIFDQELMVDDIREQKLAQNCRTRDNFVRDWLHQLLYWVLSLLLVGSGAKFLPIEARRFSLPGTTLHIYSSCLAIIKMQQMQQNALEPTFCLLRPAASLSLAQHSVHIFLPCNHQNATKCSRAKFLPIKSRGFSNFSTMPLFLQFTFFHSG